MSFYRLIFYSAVIGGWSAFAGWLMSEIFLLRRTHEFGLVPLVLTAAIVGAGIAGALNMLAGAANGQWRRQVPRALLGMLGGFIGGAVGGLVGALIYQLYAASFTRAIGWSIMGLAIGCVEGIYDRSLKKIRNGVLGGSIGGFLGGLLFNPVHDWIGSDLSSRATAFVILGLFIGLFIGLAQVILKEAWLTVVDGFRPGRQLILTSPETWLGTSEKAQLPFIAFGAKGVEPVHLRILRRQDGAFVLQDNNSRTGTYVNGMRIQAVLLKNGDMIQLGPNVVRFGESYRRPEGRPQVMPAASVPARPLAPPPAAIAVGVPPTGHMPTGHVPTGHVPTGHVPTGHVPTGHVPTGHVPTGHVRPAPRPALSGIPVSKPAAPPPVRQAPPPTPPRASPAPVRSGPPPAAPPPAASPVTPASNACPICARPAKGTPGKRVCENCGIKF